LSKDSAHAPHPPLSSRHHNLRINTIQLQAQPAFLQYNLSPNKIQGDENKNKMPRILWTLALASGLAAPLFQYPAYAALIFTLTIFWNHLFPSHQPSPGILLLPTKKPYLAALKPLEDPTSVEGEHCPTCWDELDATNAPTKLSCAHVFCNQDIKDWLNSGKNTCPVCKKVLFQQAMFQGKDAYAEKAHKARVCLVAMNLLLTILRQIFAFIARHPEKQIQFTRQWLNPIYYLTGYGNTGATISAAVTTMLDIIQLLTAYHGFNKMGPEWFKMNPGHWGWWAGAVFTTANNTGTTFQGCRQLGWVAWRILLWRWNGAPRSLYSWDASSADEVSKNMADVAKFTDDVIVEVTAAWDEFGNQVI
jgi:hypothetical protein